MATLLASALEWDAAMGKRVFLATQRDSTLRLVSTLVSLSCDEAVWLLMPVLAVATQWFFRWGPESVVGFSSELLGDVLMCCVVEMCLKFIFRRTRPDYTSQGTFYVLPGEWWSFPSGHTQRAAYLARRATIRLVPLAANAGVPAAVCAGLPVALLVWAFAVAWCRVAKGRHYPLDTAAGLITGILVAEMHLSAPPWVWGAAKVCAGSLTGAVAAVTSARPELRLEGYSVHVVFQVLWWASQPFNTGLPLDTPAILALALPNATVFAILGHMRVLP